MFLLPSSQSTSREDSLPLNRETIRMLRGGEGGGAINIYLNLNVSNEMLSAEGADKVDWRGITERHILREVKQSLNRIGEPLGRKLEVFG